MLKIYIFTTLPYETAVSIIGSLSKLLHDLHA